MPTTLSQPKPSPDKQCSLGRVHPAHRWWSRSQQCYFHCFGRREPRRQRRANPVNEPATISGAYMVHLTPSDDPPVTYRRVTRRIRLNEGGTDGPGPDAA